MCMPHLTLIPKGNLTNCTQVQLSLRSVALTKLSLHNFRSFLSCSSTSIIQMYPPTSCNGNQPDPIVRWMNVQNPDESPISSRLWQCALIDVIQKRQPPFTSIGANHREIGMALLYNKYITPFMLVSTNLKQHPLASMIHYGKGYDQKQKLQMAMYYVQEDENSLK